MNDTLKLSDSVSYISTAICCTIGTAVGFALGIEIGNFNDNTDFFWAVGTGVIAGSFAVIILTTVAYLWLYLKTLFSIHWLDNFIQILVFSQGGIVVSLGLKSQLLMATGFVISYWIIFLASLGLMEILQNAKAGTFVISAMIFIYLSILALGMAVKLEAITKMGLVFGHLSVVSLWRGCFGGINTMSAVIASAILTTITFGATILIKLVWLGLTSYSLLKRLMPI